MFERLHLHGVVKPSHSLPPSILLYRTLLPSFVTMKRQRYRNRSISGAILLATFWAPQNIVCGLHVQSNNARVHHVATSGAIRRQSFLTKLHGAAKGEIDHSGLSLLERELYNVYPCKKFRRSDGSEPDGTASHPDPVIVQKALYCLNLARQAPSAYNAQPYKLLLVHSPEQKLAMSKYCLGPNRGRVLDSDCTVVFLADKQILKTVPKLSAFLIALREKRGKHHDKWMLRKQLLYMAVFSSGYPIPRVFAASISFLFRTAMSVLNWFTFWFYPMPTLSSAEAWSSKQTLMVAMTYMLACSTCGLASIPMEGINSAGLRHALKIPSRYAIPLVVSTGTDCNQVDPRAWVDYAQSRRYAMHDVIFGNKFGEQLEVASQSYY